MTVICSEFIRNLLRLCGLVFVKYSDQCVTCICLFIVLHVLLLDVSCMVFRLIMVNKRDVSSSWDILVGCGFVGELSIEKTK